jgi:hypothetical protein
LIGSQKGKVRTSYCLLILDGHGSHLTKDFFRFLSQQQDSYYDFSSPFNPHVAATQCGHVVPFAQHYLARLSEHLHGSQGLLHVKKGDFTDLFWPAYKASYMRSNILKAFEATGVSPDNPEVILKCFKATTPAQ